MDFICFNGKYLPSTEPVVTAQNRSFRYGDGVFETIKVYKGKILLEQLHYDRLFLSLKMLQIANRVSGQAFSGYIVELCKKNNCINLARVRLAVFRNDEGTSEFIIEASSLSTQASSWDEKGLTIDLYPYARKNADAFSNLKTANFLPYVLASLFASERNIDDAVVLNAFNNLADTSKANIFLIKDSEILTPALHQGCVNGVMRRFLLEELKTKNYRIYQGELSEQQLIEADEVFLTNSIYDIRWVEKYREIKYSSKKTFSIHQQIISSFY